MKINLAKSAGFCFGVKRALKIALETLKTGKKVYMLGDIVHNEDIIRQLKRAGIKKIKHLEEGRDKTLLIRAHGASLNTIRKASYLGFNIINATCPMVKEIHKIVLEMEQKNYKIVVIGDKQHEEVQGIIGELKRKAIVVDRLTHSLLKKLKGIKKAAVVVQSTQNLEKAIKIVDILKRYINNLKFFNTVCKPTRTKQAEIRTMPLDNDVMLIIGSKTSANTKRLYEISKSLNKRSYWVSSEREIKRRWFKDAQSLGVTAGASTPESTTQDVIEYIKQIT